MTLFPKGEYGEEMTGADLIRRISASGKEMEDMLDAVDDDLALEDLASHLADMIVSIACVGAIITDDSPPLFLAGITSTFLKYEEETQAVLDFRAYLQNYMESQN